MHSFSINIERFAIILAKRWKRSRQYRAEEMPELKRISGNYPLPGPGRDAINREIERRAREIFNHTVH